MVVGGWRILRLRGKMRGGGRGLWWSGWKRVNSVLKIDEDVGFGGCSSILGFGNGP